MLMPLLRLSSLLLIASAVPSAAATGLNLKLPAEAARGTAAEPAGTPADEQARPKPWDSAYCRCDDSTGNCVIKSTLRLREFLLDTAMEPTRRKLRCPMFNPADDCNRVR